jgi:menaquinone-dependent protoporphyrinogen IX oxidase
MRAIILYYSKTGHTRDAAEDIAEGLRAGGVETDLAEIRQGARGLETYDIVVIGSPCHAGSMRALSSGVAQPVQNFLASFQPGSLRGKRVGVFSVQSGYGADQTMWSLERIARQLGAEQVERGPVVSAGVPLSLWRGPDASPEDREKLRAFGRRLAQLP